MFPLSVDNVDFDKSTRGAGKTHLFFSVIFVQLGKWCMLHFLLSLFVDKLMKQFFLFSFMLLSRLFTELGR